MRFWLLLTPILLFACAACIDESPLDDSVRSGDVLTPPPSLTPTQTATVLPTSTRAPAPVTASPTAVATTGTPVVAPTVAVQAACPSAEAGETGPTPETGEVSPRLQAPTGVALPAAYAPIPLVPDAALEGQLREILGAQADNVSIIAKDLSTGRGVSINAGNVYYSASLFKMFVMFELFNQQSQGLLTFSDTYTMTPYYDAYGLGPRDTELCGQYTVAELMAAMMSISDNSAAVLLQDLAGAGNINNSMAALGLTVSELTPEDIPTTARDIALLTEAIGTGAAVNRDASETMVALMSLEIFDNGLDGGVPESAVVAHKTGNWPTARHDAGIVFAENSTYIAVLLSANVDAGLLQQVSQALYSYYNG